MLVRRIGGWRSGLRSRGRYEKVGVGGEASGRAEEGAEDCLGILSAARDCAFDFNGDYSGDGF